MASLSRQDLEDLLNDPSYFQAIFHSLESVKAIYKSHAELGTANEAIAQRNLALQDAVYALRSDTQAAFDDSKQLQAKWLQLEREQKEVFQVRI